MTALDNGASVKLEDLRAIVRTLRDRDCDYLGNYKLGYDSALTDLLREVEDATAR